MAVPLRVAESQATPGVVAVEHRRDRLRYVGTGAVIASGRDVSYVLTAGHVVAGPGATRVLAAAAVGEPPTWRAARILACESALEVGDVVSGAELRSGMGDYAVLACDGLAATRGVDLAASDPPWGASALVETIDHDCEKPLTRLRVPLDLRPMGPDNPFLLGVPRVGRICAGMSGSPVLADGRLVAMLVAIADSAPPGPRHPRAGDGHYAVLVRAPVIARFLEERGLGWLLRPERAGHPAAPGH